MLRSLGTLRRVLLRRISTFSTSRILPVASKDTKLVLRKSIACSEPSQALAAFDKLQQESVVQDPQLLQQLALLVAKRGQPHETPKAVKILQQLLTNRSFQTDDTTQLAAIYTLDACLQQRRLQDALMLFKAVQEKDILVDLVVVDALLKMLVDAHQVDEAVDILKSVMKQHDVRPTEQTFETILIAMMHQQRYEDVVALIEFGRVNQVDFSTETYDPLVDLSQEQHTAENAERLGKFMEYVNDALKIDEQYWEEDGDNDRDEIEFDDDDDDFEDELDDEFD
ncbi:unnamed protein product [Peronospora destructor]|uniref:Pentacotripeptide-repeat region of PRORP domain-containing protein n=1 Tax=Peronospora destructor TaxID=86335 RepID=A0AAV0V068_9STRA|nr:unnamed protein product [Peronospora destructor]